MPIQVIAKHLERIFREETPFFCTAAHATSGPDFLFLPQGGLSGKQSPKL
jgi:hypothetical protein